MLHSFNLFEILLKSVKHNIQIPFDTLLMHSKQICVISCRAPFPIINSFIYFSCANHNCINADWRCDFDDDCGDNSDELNCPQSTCETNGGYKCGNKTTGGICLRKEWKCDGQLDCRDKSDEKGIYVLEL